MSYFAFKQALKQNPQFRDTTVNEYSKIIKLLINEYGEEPSIDQINDFITKKSKDRQTNAKYAIKHWLKYMKRETDYYKLNSPSRQSPLRQGVYLEDDKVYSILDNLEKKKHYAIAFMQSLSGKRARAILTIKIENIYFKKEENKIEIIVEEKGMHGAKKIEYLFMDMKFKEMLDEFIKGRQKGYLFLEDSVLRMGEDQIRARIDTSYKRYWEDLKQAARQCGINMATHDFRRTMADYITRKGMDSKEGAILLGHASEEMFNRYKRKVDTKRLTEAVQLERQHNIS